MLWLLYLFFSVVLASDIDIMFSENEKGDMPFMINAKELETVEPVVKSIVLIFKREYLLFQSYRSLKNLNVDSKHLQKVIIYYDKKDVIAKQRILLIQNYLKTVNEKLIEYQEVELDESYCNSITNKKLAEKCLYSEKIYIEFLY